MNQYLRSGILLAILAAPVLSACLNANVYTAMNLTALASPQTTNVTVCKNMYSQFGYCVNQDQVVDLINKRMYQTTRGLLRMGDGIRSVLRQIDNRLDKMIANSKKIANNATLINITVVANTTVKARLLQVVNATVNASANGTLPPPNGTAPPAANGTVTVSGSGTVKLPPPPPADGKAANNKTVVVKSDKDVKKINAKDMNLKNETIAQLEQLRTNLTNKKAVIDKFTSKAARDACYKSLNRLNIGSLCIITSGAASTYVTTDGNKIANVQIAQSDAADVTTNCLAILYPVCALQAAVNALKNSYSKSNSDPTKNNGIKSGVARVCEALANNPSCVETPSSCSADIQTLILKEMVRPGDKPFKSDDDLQTISDGIVQIDASLNATLTAGSATPARRLQTASSDDYGYQTTSGAPSSQAEADKSNIPSDSVEGNIANEVPESANSSGSARAVTAFLGAVLTLLISTLV